MAYSQKTIDAIMRAPKTQGNQLGRWAVHLNFSVVRIAKVAPFFFKQFTEKKGKASKK